MKGNKMIVSEKAKKAAHAAMKQGFTHLWTIKGGSKGIVIYNSIPLAKLLSEPVGKTLLNTSGMWKGSPIDHRRESTHIQYQAMMSLIS